ncbi:MAG TPA: ABC transporter ATP-binding protein [Candidatus Wallbacteria bacterium]|nr:ABC transporter ATP-binding protein [Candidatus Wallbacteria bacterium]
MSVVKRFYKEYAFEYYTYFVLILMCSVVVSIATALPAGIMKYVVDKVLFEKNSYYLTLISIGLIVLFIVKGVFYYFQNYYTAFVGQSVLRKLRKNIYAHINRLPISYFEDRQTGHIMARITSDVVMLQNMIDASIGVVSDLLTVLGLICWIVYIHYQLALAAFMVIPFIGFIVSKFSQKVRKTTYTLQSKVGDITSILNEKISGIRTVKAFSNEGMENDAFGKEADENFKIAMKYSHLIALILPIIEFLNTNGIVIVLGIGGYFVIKPNPSLTPGELISFLTALGMLFTPIKRLTNTTTYYQQAHVCIERIYEILDEKPEDENEGGLVEMPEIKGGIEFKNIYFKYPKSDGGIFNFSLSVKPGNITAVVGPSGSGKTTLVNLLLRFYKLNSGAIEIDGLNIESVKLRSLRMQIGIVPQDTVLFSGTILDNIKYGNPDASDEEAVTAAKMANAADFVEKFPLGFSTKVGEHGVKLSGGQRQRIAIARTILRNPKILILDEATSALDAESESLVKDALDRLMQGRTTFIIAHRLSTIKNATEIIVLEKGLLAQYGTHEKLIEIEGVYQKLYQTYFEKEVVTVNGI